MIVPGGSWENWMRKLLNIYFSGNPQSVCEESEEVKRANIPDENGRVGQEKRCTRWNNHTAGINCMPEKEKRKKKKSQKTPNHIDKQATDLARGNQEKSNRADFIMFPWSLLQLENTVA